MSAHLQTPPLTADFSDPERSILPCLCPKDSNEIYEVFCCLVHRRLSISNFRRRGHAAAIFISLSPQPSIAINLIDNYNHTSWLNLGSMQPWIQGVWKLREESNNSALLLAQATQTITLLSTTPSAETPTILCQCVKVLSGKTLFLATGEAHYSIVDNAT